MTWLIFYLSSVYDSFVKLINDSVVASTFIQILVSLWFIIWCDVRIVEIWMKSNDFWNHFFDYYIIPTKYMICMLLTSQLQIAQLPKKF